jgi:hypothetical protein
VGGGCRCVTLLLPATTAPFTFPPVATDRGPPAWTLDAPGFGVAEATRAGAARPLLPPPTARLRACRSLFIPTTPSARMCHSQPQSQPLNVRPAWLEFVTVNNILHGGCCGSRGCPRPPSGPDGPARRRSGPARRRPSWSCGARCGWHGCRRLRRW